MWRDVIGTGQDTQSLIVQARLRRRTDRCRPRLLLLAQGRLRYVQVPAVPRLLICAANRVCWSPSAQSHLNGGVGREGF
jgi:hypothetical protein